MNRVELESRLRVLADQAWESEVRWPEIEAWEENFNQLASGLTGEKNYALFALTRFTYYGRKMIREMLRSLYRDHFQAPLMQRIRRNLGGTKNIQQIQKIYDDELKATRFVSVGNPSESSAHLLYYFRQINYLSKELFCDISQAFNGERSKDGMQFFFPRESTVSRIVFFDDIVGSGNQISRYLTESLKKIRNGKPGLDLRFLSLFSTTQGIAKLNSKSLFNGKGSTLFELDSTYKAFDNQSRCFASSPEWFDQEEFKTIATYYGNLLRPDDPLGYKDGQYLIGFSHNTPNNTLPIFWDEGNDSHCWNPVFIRFDKVY